MFVMLKAYKKLYIYIYNVYLNYIHANFLPRQTENTRNAVGVYCI